MRQGDETTRGGRLGAFVFSIGTVRNQCFEARPGPRPGILVIGDLNPAVLTPGAITTGKAARAFTLQGNGQDIGIMTEDDFIRNP